LSIAAATAQAEAKTVYLHCFVNGLPGSESSLAIDFDAKTVFEKNQYFTRQYAGEISSAAISWNYTSSSGAWQRYVLDRPTLIMQATTMTMPSGTIHHYTHSCAETAPPKNKI
jgi:hypothetical protein